MKQEKGHGEIDSEIGGGFLEGFGEGFFDFSNNGVRRWLRDGIPSLNNFPFAVY